MIAAHHLTLGMILLAVVAWDCPAQSSSSPTKSKDLPKDEAPKMNRVLLLSQGPDGHPPTTHEYRAGMRVLAKLLSAVPDLKVEVISADGNWEEGPEKLRQTDCAVLFLSEGAKWIQGDPRRLDAFAQLAARGGGLVTLHWAMGTKEAAPIEGYLKLFGGCHGGPDRTHKVMDTRVDVPDPAHPIVAGIKPFPIREEFYYRLKFVKADPPPKPILNADVDGKWETVAWAWERGDGGRSFGFSGLHFHEHWRHEEYRRLITQSVLWVLKKPIPNSGLPVAIDDNALKLEQ